MAGLLFGLSLDHGSVPQRHCFYDSDEDEADSDPEQSPLFKFSGGEITVKTPCLIVCTSPVASAFAQSYLCVEKEQIAAISCTSPSKTLKGRVFTAGRSDAAGEDHVITSFHQSGGSEAVVCLHEQELNIDTCNAWSEMVFDHIVPEAVVVLHSLSLHKLLLPEVAEDDPLAALHSLQTRSWSHTQLAPFLNPPNTISDEPAAILTWCQLRGIPAAMAALHSSNMLTFSEQVTAFKPLLDHPVFSKIPLVNSQAQSDSLLKKLIPKQSTNLNSLYT